MTAQIFRGALRSLVFGVGAVALAMFLRLSLGSYLRDETPFVTFFPAVLLAAMFGGWVSGVLSVVLTLVLGKLYFDLAGMTGPQLTSALLYVTGCGLSILAAEKLRRASDRYKQAEHKLATALDISGVGTWRWDIARDRVEWDERLCRLFGVSSAEAPKTAAEFLKLVVEEDRESVLRQIQESIRNPHASEFVYRIRHPRGGIRWIADRNNVLFGPNGRPLELVGASMDITERKQADEDRDLLIRELHHRVRNTLAMVQGMANATANSAEDLAHFKETFARRIASLAMTHSLLTDERNQSTTLSRLLGQELDALGMSDRIELSGTDFLLPSEVAVPLGMAVHELATNAVKHGALRGEQGRVAVHCDLNDRAGVIAWAERNGPPVMPSQRRGFGAQLLERVIEAQLGAKTSRVFTPDGLLVTIEIPREKLTANANQQPAPVQAQAV